MYITPDYIYTIGMCTLLVQNMCTEVLITYTTTGKICCSLVNKCMPKLGYISEQPVKIACKENLETDICLCTQHVVVFGVQVDKI